MKQMLQFFLLAAEYTTNIWNTSFNALYMALKYPDYDLEDIMSDSDIIRLNTTVDNMRRDRIKEIDFKTSEGITYTITI